LISTRSIGKVNIIIKLGEWNLQNLFPSRYRTFALVNSLNILALTSWYPSDADPFLGNFVKRHCEAIATVHKVWVIFVASIDDVSNERIEKKVSGNLTEIIVYQKSSSKGWIKYLQKRKLVLRLCRDLEVDFDLLHAHTLFPLAPLFDHVSKKLHIPWMFSEHWSGFHEEFRPRVNPLKWKWIMDSAKSATMGFPVSESLAKAVSEVLPDTEMRCVANVVEDVFFQMRKSDQVNVPFRFLHVSTLVEEYKNFRGTLEAFSELHKSGEPFELVVISDGDASNAKAWTEELNLSEHIVFKGPQSPAQIAEMMAESDALVLFSNTENQPCVVLEALSSGLPVIASAVGDIPNLVTNDRGFLVPPKNVQVLAETLIRMVKSPSQFDRIKVAEGTHEKFSKEAIALAYSNAYEEVLKR
jgi:glycosyltransferase involved in cell wall biosynthesis